MKEKLTSRVGRIISGGFNALLDAVENAAPEAVMEQALREIDDAVEEVRNELGKVIANKHMANSRLLQVNQKCEDLAEKIELAVDENRDDLAEIAKPNSLMLKPRSRFSRARSVNFQATKKNWRAILPHFRERKGK